MIQLTPPQVSSRLRALFDPDTPASVRCFAVLEDQLAGQIWTDDPANPTWGLVQEIAFGTIYLGGQFDPPLLSQFITQLRQDSDVLFGFRPGDPYLPLLPASPEYEGAVLEFLDRPLGEGLETYLRQVPPGCEIRAIDRDLIERSVDRELHIIAFGSLDQALEKGRGFCLMAGDEILCETFASSSTRGLVEIGVQTYEPYQGRGYATITCAHLVQACEALGYQTYWNCAKQNLASAVVARKLGYRTEKEYNLVGWFRLNKT